MALAVLVAAVDTGTEAVAADEVSAELALVLAAAVTTAVDVAAELVDADATTDVDAAVVRAEALPLLTVPEAVLPQLASAMATIWVAPSASTVRLDKTMRLVFPP